MRQFNIFREEGGGEGRLPDVLTQLSTAFSLEYSVQKSSQHDGVGPSRLKYEFLCKQTGRQHSLNRNRTNDGNGKRRAPQIALANRNVPCSAIRSSREPRSAGYDRRLSHFRRDQQSPFANHGAVREIRYFESTSRLLCKFPQARKMPPRPPVPLRHLPCTRIAARNPPPTQGPAMFPENFSLKKTV